MRGRHSARSARYFAIMLLFARLSNEDLELICQQCKNKDDSSIERNSVRSKKVSAASRKNCYP